jgi:hypothetical protein
MRAVMVAMAHLVAWLLSRLSHEKAGPPRADAPKAEPVPQKEAAGLDRGQERGYGRARFTIYLKNLDDPGPGGGWPSLTSSPDATDPLPRARHEVLSTSHRREVERILFPSMGRGKNKSAQRCGDFHTSCQSPTRALRGGGRRPGTRQGGDKGSSEIEDVPGGGSRWPAGRPTPACAGPWPILRGTRHPMARRSAGPRAMCYPSPPGRWRSGPRGIADGAKKRQPRFETWVGSEGFEQFTDRSTTCWRYTADTGSA